MHSKKQTWIVYVALIVVITVTTFIEAKLYIPIKGVVNLEKMIEKDSIVNLSKSNSVKLMIVNDESLRVKIHNLFNDIKVSRKFFAPKFNESMPTYEIKIEYVDDNNKNITYLISIIDEKYISINGNLFVISNSIYNELQSITQMYE